MVHSLKLQASLERKGHFGLEKTPTWGWEGSTVIQTGINWTGINWTDIIWTGRSFGLGDHLD